MRAKIRQTTACRKAQRKIQDRRARLERVRRHRETLSMLKHELKEAEQLGENKEITRITRRMRTIEQQIRYIGDEYAFQ